LEKLFEEKYRVKLEEWKIEVERKLREDALAKSRAALKGKLAEQLAPMFAIFGYNPLTQSSSATQLITSSGHCSKRKNRGFEGDNHWRAWTDEV